METTLKDQLMTATVYEIAKWAEVFETSESRRYKTLSWVSMPISFTSSGYQSLLEEFGDRAPYFYGTWCVLVAFAAQMPVRGRLSTSKGHPIAWGHVSRVSGFPVEAFESLAAWATRPDVLWLIPAETLENQPENSLGNTHPTITQQSPNNQTGDTLATDITQPNKTQPTNQPSKNGAGGRAGGEDFFVIKTWNQVGDKLASLGSSRWREAVTEAKECGCTPELAGELIRYGLANEYGIGAIVVRLCKARPALATDAGWPGKPGAATKLAESQDRQQRKREQGRLDAAAERIIKAGRKARKTDEQIQADLDEKGLQWPQ